MIKYKYIIFKFINVLQLKNISIQNFRSIENDTIEFGENKTVFVGKNGSGKTNILKAVEKLINSKNIKEKDFHNLNEKIVLESTIIYNNTEIYIKSESIFNKGKVVTNTTQLNNEIKNILKKINLIYIPSDRKINKENKEDGYMKLINLILRNKETSKNTFKQAKLQLESIKGKSGRKKTTLLISLLKLFLYSINETNNRDFNIFIIDQPENFLHPHATQMIDSILEKIGELENTQILYSTHSPDLVSNFKKGKYEISDIVFVREDDEITITKKIDNRYGRYNKIMINLIFKNASIFFSDAVLLVEGETEKISIPNIYENTLWEKYSEIESKNLNKEEKENYFNLSYKNISIIDVGGKGSLYEWFTFASELFGKQNVVALIDRDHNFEVDREMISKSIKKVYKLEQVYENEFKKYNWIVLDGEFEYYYDIKIIRQFIYDTLKKRSERFGDNFNPKKFERTLKKLDLKLERLKQSKKISSAYEKLFNGYYKKYSKPTIAFNLSIWLSQNKGYDKKLIKLFGEIVEKFDN